MNDWLRLALSGPVVRRGLMYAVIVGPILILINHGDALLHAQITAPQVAKMGLTVVVPYLVSTFSSVAAMRVSQRGVTGSP